MAFSYHSPAELQQLGEKIRDKAVRVTMDQAASYAAAQQAANNDATRSDTGQLPQVQGYTTPAQGRPDDEGNLRAYVGQAYAEIPAMFAVFGLPNPDDSRPMLDALYSVAATVEVDLQLTSRDNKIAAPSAVSPISGTASVGEVVDLIGGHMKEWTGDAALAFELYLKNNVRAAALHREIALSLALSLEAQLEINRRINTDIWEIGQKTYKALDGLDAWCPGANASKSVALLTISGAIAAVIFTGATAGAGGAAFAAAVGVEGLQSLATTLSNTGPLQNKKVDIGGLTVPPIITGMQNAMTELTKSIDAQQQELASGLTTFTQDVHANWNRILVPGPREMNDVRNADGASLKTSDSFRVR
ncbi:hypothetical protein [Paractinoplanes hotanensis]|uniref:Uncharacterized protein n=1 Tax=Paractinoplanes hotanensis TaxID=2906497 RepID=A0ABT0YAL7_9ACTN|nr:hypothetical protein [Actinoplanes hotanensis]MCM4083083.1 hypothetical protein [Actinoplanes hotanensis]